MGTQREGRGGKKEEENARKKRNGGTKERKREVQNRKECVTVERGVRSSRKLR